MKKEHETKTKPSMKVETVAIDAIKPYDNNPRKNDGAVDAVAKSIQEFGWRAPIVVDADMVVVCGHTRLKAAQKLGLTEVPVHIADGLTPEQIQAFRIADNKTAEIAEWDMNKLAIELGALLESNSAELSGFTLDEIGEILADENAPVEGMTDKDAVSEPPVAPVSVPGTLYALGSHRLLCGDSTRPDDVAKVMSNGGGYDLASLWLTDPPYNVEYEGKTKDKLKIQNDKMKNDKFLSFLKDAFSAAITYVEPGGAFYIWHADCEYYNFLTACFNAGIKVRQCLIWKKDAFVLSRQDYHYKHEPCLYGWKDGAPHKWYSDRKQTTVLDFNRPQRNDVHPTMKPVDLFEYLIKNSSKRDEIVLDTFGGSGTTLIACERLGRKARLIELDPKYCDVIRKRWAEYVHGPGCDWESLTPEIKETENEQTETND